MTNSSHHLAYHAARRASDSRVHALARVHPVERRSVLTLLRYRRRVEPAYVREFKIA